MKTEKNDAVAILLSALNERLEVDAVCAAAHVATKCGGVGYVEYEEYAEVPDYTVIDHRGTHPTLDQFHIVTPPKTKVRTLCPCAGRPPLNDDDKNLLKGLMQVFDYEINADATPTAIGAFNNAARAQLAQRAKDHELGRKRHEAAEKIEHEAAEKAAAIRAGSVQPETNNPNARR